MSVVCMCEQDALSARVGGGFHEALDGMSFHDGPPHGFAGEGAGDLEDVVELEVGMIKGEYPDEICAWRSGFHGKHLGEDVSVDGIEWVLTTGGGEDGFGETHGCQVEYKRYFGFDVHIWRHDDVDGVGPFVCVVLSLDINNKAQPTRALTLCTTYEKDGRDGPSAGYRRGRSPSYEGRLEI